MDSFNINDYFKFDEFDLSPDQTVSETGFPQNHFNQMGSPSQHPQAEMYLPNAIDGRYRLLEMPPYDPFVTSMVELSSQPANTEQSDLIEFSRYQEHWQLSGKQELPPCGQAMSDVHSHLEVPSFDFNTLDPTDSQQDFQQSDISFAFGAPNRLSSQAMVSADPASTDYNEWAVSYFLNAHKRAMIGSATSTNNAAQRISTAQSPGPVLSTLSSRPTLNEGLGPVERKALPRMSMRCDWPSCVRLRFDTRGDLTSHQETHFAELSAQWEKLSGCSWHGCRSQQLGRMFKTRADYRKHLRKHIKSHWCDQDGCSYDKPFGTQHDLNRHIQSAHSDVRSFCCPIDSCPRSTLGFPRKDKLDDHVKKEHDMFQCTFDHCKALVLDPERENHLKRFHSGNCIITFYDHVDGVYECALTGCESTKSMFNHTSARRHLHTHHGLSFDASLGIIRRCEKTPSAESDVRIIRTDRPHQSCKICLKKKSDILNTQQAANTNSSA